MRARAGPPLPLPPAVGWELARIERLLGQLADPQARQLLADVGEAPALRVLRMIAESPTPVKNFSAYIMWTARRAPDSPRAESATAWSSAPSRGGSPTSFPLGLAILGYSGGKRYAFDFFYPFWRCYTEIFGCHIILHRRSCLFSAIIKFPPTCYFGSFWCEMYPG
jgi:hypothetical protein